MSGFQPEIRQMKRAKKLSDHAPHNPLVVAVKFRKAGAHGKSKKALRREEKMKSKNWCPRQESNL